MQQHALHVIGNQQANAARIRQQILALLADYSIEVTPKTWAKQPEIGALLPAGTRVYIAFVPGEDWRQVAATAAAVRAAGLAPVPHFPARSLRDRAEVAAYLEQVAGRAGATEALAIGGGIDQPVGAFASTAALLETGLLEAFGIRTIGLAGHPEGQRELPPPGAATTLEQKWRAIAQSSAAGRLVTQFLFDPDLLLGWEATIRAHGNTLPIHVGIPGPATLKTLLNFARLCGVGNSMRMLTRQSTNLLRLARPSFPDRMITALARHVAEDRATRIARLHLFPFGGLLRTVRWVEAARAGRFELQADGQGFTVDDEPQP
jgi:methylenetetrahydrofolate reductase (NADPH)